MYVNVCVFQSIVFNPVPTQFNVLFKVPLPNTLKISQFGMDVRPLKSDEFKSLNLLIQMKKTVK